ncbi:MAG TPA: hypothetical protein VIR38_01205 [Thalassobaculum sp.]
MKLPSPKSLPAIKLEPHVEAEPEPRPAASVTVDQIAAASPALLDSRTVQVRREPRVRLAINHLPQSYKRAFQEKARELNMTDKGLFIEMMRHFGLDVVPADQIDGRIGPGRGAADG